MVTPNYDPKTSSGDVKKHCPCEKDKQQQQQEHVHSAEDPETHVTTRTIRKVVPDYLTGVDLNSKQALRSFNPVFLRRAKKMFRGKFWTIRYAVSMGLGEGIQIYNPFFIRVNLEDSPFDQYEISHDGTSRGWYSKLKSRIQDLNNLANDIDIVTESGLLLDQYSLEELYSRRNTLQSFVKILDTPRVYENKIPSVLDTSLPIPSKTVNGGFSSQQGSVVSIGSNSKSNNHVLEEITKNFVNDIVDGIETQIKNGTRFKDIIKNHSSLLALVLQALQRETTQEFARDAGMTNENLSSLVPYVRDKLSSLADQHKSVSLVGCNVCGGQVQTMVRPSGGYDNVYQDSEFPMRTGCPYCGGSSYVNPQEEYQPQGAQFQGSHLFSSSHQQLIGAPHGGGGGKISNSSHGRTGSFTQSGSRKGGSINHDNRYGRGYGHGRGHGHVNGSLNVPLVLGGGYYGTGGVWYDGNPGYYENGSDYYDNDDNNYFDGSVDGSDDGSSDGYESDSFISTEIPVKTTTPSKLIGDSYDEKNVTQFVRSQMIGSQFFDGFMASSSGLLKSLRKTLFADDKGDSDSDHSDYDNKHKSKKDKKSKKGKKGKKDKNSYAKQNKTIKRSRNDFLVTPETQNPSFESYSEDFTAPQFNTDSGDNRGYSDARRTAKSVRCLRGPNGEFIVDDNTFKNPEKYLAISLRNDSGLYDSDGDDDDDYDDDDGIYGKGENHSDNMNGFSVKQTEDSYGPEIRWSAPQTYERMNGDDKYDTGVTQNQKSPKIPDTSNFMNLLKDNKPLMARLSANGGKWILFVPTNKAFTSKRSTLIASFDESKRDKYLSKYLCRNNSGTDPRNVSGITYVSTSGDHVFQMEEPLGDTGGYKHLVANHKHSGISFPIEAHGKLSMNQRNSGINDYSPNDANVYVFVHSAPLEKLPRNV